MPRYAAALAVASVTLLLYRSTLLPSVDFGDTASFQVTGGSPVVTPRDAYPLYYAIAGVFVGAIDGERAFAMNLVSAVEGAIACGILTLLAAEVSGSVLAAVAAALLFGGSYTFWSQAVIAEVYGLHILLVSLTLLLLLRWARHPTLGRLALFFGAYAVSFGNHLSMILLAPAYALFLLSAAPRGWRSMIASRVVLMALGFAAVGALQYVWNFSALWIAPTPPQDLVDALRTFWFDVTKSDWRETMVLRVPASAFAERLQMYAFDVGQQFGWAGPPLAAAGAVQLIRADPRRAVLVIGLYAVNLVFALGYNVGDSHVFLLPSHLMLALLTASGIVLLEKLTPARGVVAVLAIAFAGSRIHENYPALDRSDDLRPIQALTALTTQLDERNALLLTDLNWQIQNGLTYFVKEKRPDLAHARMLDVILYAPVLINDNLENGRDIVLTERARAELDAAYGPLFPSVPDPRVSVPELADLTRGLPPGTRYVLTILRPSREFSLDAAALTNALRHLTSGGR